jgi:hypothetical protein
VLRNSCAFCLYLFILYNSLYLVVCFLMNIGKKGDAAEADPMEATNGASQE